MLVPVGATLVARDNLVCTVRGLTTKYRSRASLERELRQRRNRVEKLVADASERIPSVS